MPKPEPIQHNNGVNKYGLKGRKIPNPTKWEVNEDATGNLSGTIEYHYDVEPGERIPDGFLPQRGEYHPYDSRLMANTINESYQQNNICKVTVGYVGMSGGTASSGGDISDLSWEFQAQTSDEPIDTHPNFFNMGVIKSATAGIADVGLPKIPSNLVPYNGEPAVVDGAYTQTGLVKWDRTQVEVDSNQKFVGFKNTKQNRTSGLAGVRAYKCPQGVMRINFTSNSTGRYQWVLKSLGMVFEDIPLINEGSSLGTYIDKRNWLLTNASISKHQGVYKYQLEFTLSAPSVASKGWNEYVYVHASAGNKS